MVVNERTVLDVSSIYLLSDGLIVFRFAKTAGNRPCAKKNLTVRYNPLYCFQQVRKRFGERWRENSNPGL